MSDPVAIEQGKKKNKGGRPPIHLDVDRVRQLATIHCTVPEAAYVLGVGEQTLLNKIKREPYKTAWEGGRATGKMSLRRAMFQTAIGVPERTEVIERPDGTKITNVYKGQLPNITAQIWLSKQSEERGGLSMVDRVVNEHPIDAGNVSLFDLLVAGKREASRERTSSSPTPPDDVPARNLQH